MVRVIISIVDKMKYDKRDPVVKPAVPSIEDVVAATRYNIQVCGSSFRCLDCIVSVSRTSPNVRNWLKAKCLALPAISCDSFMACYADKW